MLTAMKVEGPGSTGKLGQAKKAAKTGGAKGTGFSSALRGSDGADEAAEETAPLSGGGALGSVDALLALQGVDAVDAPDPNGRRRNGAAARRGGDLLDRLDEIRIALLSGSLSMPQLERLQTALQARGEEAADPALRSLVQDIELRVAVELAKYGSRR